MSLFQNKDQQVWKQSEI